MARRTLPAALISAALMLSVLPGAAAAAPPPLPASLAAVGDSITQAASTGGSLGVDYPQNSWSTGSNTAVNSHYLRLRALNPAIGQQAHNLSVSGARMAGLQAQMDAAGDLDPEYLTVLIGGNDICTDTEAQMTSVADFRAQFQAALATLAAESPSTNVYVVSIPRVLGLWELFRNDWWARVVWSVGDICQSLLANPTSTQTADVERRQRVAQRNIDFNQVLYEVCSTTPRCLWDGWAAYGTAFTRSDVSGDYFHPSTAGQAKLAAVSWAAGYWKDGAPPPLPDNQAPVAAFSFECADLACSFDGSASADGDGSVVAHAWDFEDGTDTGATVSHTFSAAGDYDVTLAVTDDDGATGSITHTVSVSAPDPGPSGTVSIGTLDGESAPRKGGWSATVTVTAVDDLGNAVSGASVTGSWSGDGTGGCTTGSGGSCSFGVNLAKKATSVQWTVSGIAHSTLAYDPSGNVAGSITLLRP